MSEDTHKENQKQDIPDNELVISAISGEQNAYTLLMQRHKEGLTLYVHEFIGNLKNSEGIIELAE